MRSRLTGAQGKVILPVFVKSISSIALIAFLIMSPIALAQREGNAGSSHESERAAQVRALNNSVLQLHGQMQDDASEAAAGIRSQAATVLARRAAALQVLIQEDPHAGLSFAFSPELLSDLAAKFPDSVAHLESHVALSGVVEHWTADYADSKTSRESWYMSAAGARLKLHFAFTSPRNFDGGVTTISGVRLGNDVAVESAKSHNGSTSLPFSEILKIADAFLLPCFVLVACGLALVLSSGRAGVRACRQLAWGPLKRCTVCAIVLVVLVCNPVGGSAQDLTCSTIGVQNVAVLLVTFPGVTPPANITQQSVYDMFFGTTGPSLDGYWREASYGQTSAKGNVFGWYTLDATYADCTRLDLVRDAAITAAANSGVAIQSYNRIFIVTADFGCGWTGLAINSCTSLNSPSGSFVASASFLNASWQRSQIEGAENAAHEGGHNMGLAHAQSRTFGTEPLGPPGTAGTITEYGDPFSDMASSNSGHYAVPHKAEILNWITSGINYQVVQSSGTWTLQPLELNPAGLVALKVQRGTGNNSWIWVEYRQPIGLYESIWAPSGALIHFEDSTSGTHTQLLDFTPTTSGLYDSALMPGKTWSDSYTNVSITVQSAAVNALTVTVDYGAAPCTASAPSVVVSPLDPSIYPGQSANYSASVKNNDGAGCPASTINLASAQPSGWATSFSAASVTLSPGQSASIALGKSAPSGTPAGTYAVDLTASTGAATGSATANATVVTPPSLVATLSVSGTIFSRPGTVPIVSAVANGGVPVSGASVTFTITAPNGSTSSQSATTGSTGIATWNYKLGQRSQAGTYSVSVRATVSSGSRKNASSQSASSNVVSFSVQ
jgi:M6 family metalloprotease-like protein